jgi:hypothetical protein
MPVKGSQVSFKKDIFLEKNILLEHIIQITGTAIMNIL